jgi:hypothetical protein
MKKLLLTCLAALLVFGLVACKSDEDNGDKDIPGGINSYTIEAEYIDLDGIQGAGVSSEASGVSMIIGEGTPEHEAKGWSNGYYVGFTHSAGLELSFKFNSDNAAVATIILRLGSEVGDITFSPESLAVKLNGTVISYSNIFVAGSDMDSMTFSDKTITTSAALITGENIITLEVLNNTLRNGQVAGPMIDCIKIKTVASLTWTDKTENPGLRGAI